MVQARREITEIKYATSCKCSHEEWLVHTWGNDCPLKISTSYHRSTNYISMEEKSVSLNYQIRPK